MNQQRRVRRSTHLYQTSLSVSELRDLVYREVELRAQAHIREHEAAARAADAAADHLNHRLETLNQFRAAMADQAAHYQTRDEAAGYRTISIHRLDVLTKGYQELQLAHSILQTRLYTIVGVLTITMAVVSTLMGIFR